MASVLTAFRDNTDKVGAAIAECRRLGIEVRPPDVETSGLDFTVEGDAIRFGLMAVKNVGQGAIESIVQARQSDGPFRSLLDFCNRVDLRLTNKRVVESLVRVGALNRLGHPAQLLLALDDAMASAQAEQRDRLTGQTSLFDGAAEGQSLERPLAPATEAPMRERLRWEKELLGLYLSDHPLGDIAEEIGRYVNAYSGDLGEELDQQRVVVGGVVTEVRRVITKARATMGVATLEDLQGSLEVIVFPKVLELTAASWEEDAILLVAGRVDHKGDESVLLADAVWTWEDASAMGPEGFARAVAAGDRRGFSRRPPNGAAGPGGPATGPGGRFPGREPMAVAVQREPVGVMAAAGPQRGNGEGVRRTVPLVSPLRGGEVRGTIEVVIGGARPRAPEPRVEPTEPPSVELLDPDHEDESALPDEARSRVLADEAAPTQPVEALPGQRLHVRFGRTGPETIVGALETLRQVLQARPGETPITLHIPAGAGREQPMELRSGVAYDAELVTEIQRRLGKDLARLDLGS
jgi:hypothetical protein